MPLIRGGLQRVRLTATFVDVAGSGDRWTGPDDLDLELISILCAGATLMYVLGARLVSTAREAIPLVDLVDGLPDDLTGIDLLRQLFQALGIPM